MEATTSTTSGRSSNSNGGNDNGNVEEILHNEVYINDNEGDYIGERNNNGQTTNGESASGNHIEEIIQEMGRTNYIDAALLTDYRDNDDDESLSSEDEDSDSDSDYVPDSYDDEYASDEELETALYYDEAEAIVDEIFRNLLIWMTRSTDGLDSFRHEFYQFVQAHPHALWEDDYDCPLPRFEDRRPSYIDIFENLECPLWMVHSMVYAWPDIVKQRPKHRKLNAVMTTLHLACLSNPSLEVLEFLIPRYPEALKIKDDVSKQLPLHFLLNSSGHTIRIEQVRYMVDIYRRSVHEKDANKQLALHMACEKLDDFAVINYLALQYPKSVDMKDRFEQTPLVLLSRTGSSFEATIKPFVETWPSALNYSNFQGDNLLHRLCYVADPNIDLIEYIIERYPKLMWIQNMEGFLPTHMAAAGDSDYTLVDLLVTKFPNTFLARSKDGKTPLHLASLQTASMDKIRSLCTSVSVESQDHSGNTPLHLAVQVFLGSSAAVKVLLDGYPQTLEIVNKKGNSPLHEALAIYTWKSCFKDLTSQLIQTHALKIQNKDGQLPIHLASIYGHSLTVIQEMVREWPESLTEQDPYSGFCPFQLAALQKQDEFSAIEDLEQLQIIYFLLSKSPDVLLQFH